MADLMALGTFKFVVTKTAFAELSEAFSWRWTENERIGRNSSLYFGGIGAQALELSGSIYKQTAGARIDAMSELQKIADKGKPVALLDAAGRHYGRFAITGIQTKKDHFTQDAQPRRVEFTVQLKRAMQ